MTLVSQPGLVSNITADQLREYMSHHGESEYQLVDVRESEEYEQGHIPGAQLIPLSELEARQPQVRRLSERKTIFYCRSGGRSMRAASWASQLVQLRQVFNLVGGMMGWEGRQVADFPRMRTIDLRGGVDSLLRQALDLEKGTHELYELLVREYVEGPIAEVMAKLADAELVHAELVHRLLSSVSEVPIPSFAEMFAAAPGRLVEGGESYEHLVQRARSLAGRGDAALLELALEIELAAYDLYKSLSATITSEPAKSALLDLAQQEKRHSDTVLKALVRTAQESD